MPKPLSQTTLKSVIHYNPHTGDFTWIAEPHRGPKGRLGKTCGQDNGRGYLHTTINCGRYYLHRLAFLYMTGEWPETVDHIDRCRSNNRWDNLRSVSLSQNLLNKGRLPRNTSGYRGVSEHRPGTWRARIQAGGVSLYRGGFSTPQAASAWYEAKAKQLHGEFYGSQ